MSGNVPELSKEKGYIKLIHVVDDTYYCVITEEEKFDDDERYEPEYGWVLLTPNGRPVAKSGSIFKSARHAERSFKKLLNRLSEAPLFVAKPERLKENYKHGDFYS